MRTAGALLPALLLFLHALALQAQAAEDLYWEGEEDESNEFLEVKDEYVGLGGHLSRFKRGLFDLFSVFDTSTTTTTENYESITEDQELVDEEQPSKDDEVDGEGSGRPERERETEPREKTLRVTFVVNQPYRSEYSNRDSDQFQTFSRALADAVNLLFDSLPGTQRASLVRIQSRISDEFTCKVTLDIVTTGFDDTQRITKLLRSHIHDTRKLGSVVVSDADFSATVIDPGNSLEPKLDACGASELRCNDGRCVSGTARCNGKQECADGSDEASCPPSENAWLDQDQNTNQGADDRGDQPLPTIPPPYPTSWQPWVTERGDTDVYGTNQDNDQFTTTEKNDACANDELRCDETRCVPLVKRCDGVADCYDRTDELNCQESCGADDFRCNNGKCIASNRRCDRIVDCPSQEDEENCVCKPEEFRCISDGICIENRKRCDGIGNCADSSDEADCEWSGHHVCKDRGKFRCGDGTCISVLLRCDGFRDCARDGSDELHCPCSSDQWQCDHGSCIKRTKRCDGRVDCPTDRSDERNCLDNRYFRCRSGKRIPQALRCNRRYDCPTGDYSDEQNCPCGDGDFKCDNGYCIPESKHCDRTHDCQDRSDERGCTYGSECMSYQYKCLSGQCVEADSRCNGTTECVDSSDETNCPCKRDQFNCRDGTCISIGLRCDAYRDCPSGDDELDCGTPSCPPDSFTCAPTSRILCAKRCDGNTECDNGEDESDCPTEPSDCNHECDGRCLEDSRICDGRVDCSDGSDEQCYECDGPHDFRCRNGECISVSQKCNGVPECSDYSDEDNCNETMTPSPRGCTDNQFQCNDGSCIDSGFVCDNHSDCLDNSDEDNCSCEEDKWQCASGQCIPDLAHCDGTVDCADSTDELGCPTSPPSWFATTYPPYQPSTLPPPIRTYAPPTRPPYITPTARPYAPPATASPFYTTTPYRPYTRPSAGGSQDRCSSGQWRCENGPCIDSHRRCDGHVDCPFDTSDEFDCPAGSPIALVLKTYPDAQIVRNGGDVVFQCRDEGPLRVPVRWVREGGRPLKPGASDKNGRLEINKVSVSDSGVYICQAVRYLGVPGSEISVQLTVASNPVTSRPPGVAACTAYQATCGNGQCIPKNAVCDGKPDCIDGSDEDACNSNGMCEPNQYQCANRKCVLKTWLCDSEDDCGDGSDEQNCGSQDPRQPCLPVEFKCQGGNQCVPKSFHCDGQSDCFDGSDEIGCAPVYVTKPPTPPIVRPKPGESLTLVCEAVGVPTPLISWRLNWGHVPDKCTSTSINGIGTLICPNMQPGDSGAYSCEAINNKGTTFGAPDSIVFVNNTDVCPNGFFNNEARSESECIRCFCFGESSQCRSADLFTYDMATPLGEGGTRLVGVKQTYNGQVVLDSQPITDQYYYQPLRNGATVTKLASYGSGWPQSQSSAHPYLTLPETYNGNQLTSYGGHIKYRLSPHSPRYGISNENVPDVIIKGKYESLIYRHRGDKSRETYVEARFTPEHWQKAGPSGLSPATREDIMMALDNIEMILLRADLNNAGVNITDFAMESAQHINVGLGAANLVEECTCPPGYEGLSCQKCASGYVREKSGPWLGNCVKETRPCPPGSFGDPSSGYGCRPCPCPLTNRENQFARTCHIGPNGGVVCDCAPGYGGQNCEYCEAGFIGNPMIPGDSCRPEPVSNCNPVGTVRTILPDECQCKDNVRGRYCDLCTNGSFYLSSDFRQGCALCFCSGVSQECMSSNLRRKTTTVRFNTPQIVEQVRIYNSAPQGPSSVKYSAPVETELKPRLLRGELGLNEYDRSRPMIYYWSLPAVFAGDKVTAYGGYLRYILRNIPAGSQSSKNNAADVQLISDNHLTFHYFSSAVPSNDGTLNASIPFLEKGWQRPDGKEVSREHFLLALADLKAVLIKATYTTASQVASLDSASIDTAEPNGDGPPALHVEQCVCPTGYVGTSCEDCAPGYTRSSSGIYLEHCDLCNCNGHSNMCHPETGVCYNCNDNTDGENCEICKSGYERNEYGDCVPSQGISTSSPGCGCDSRGEAAPCDNRGFCSCKQNVEGQYCDRCRPGTFGLDGDNPLGCLPCYCSGVTTDCHEASHYTRIPLAAPIFGDNYGGYSLTDLNAEQVINDQFVPAPNESELMYIFTFPPREELYWSLPVFPGNRVLSYGGSLSLTQKFESGGGAEVSTPGNDVILVGDTISVYWTNRNPIRSGEAFSYQVPLRESEWYILNSATPASRDNFMSVLRDLKRVLVRATLAANILSTAIADVAMDTAAESYTPDLPAAKGVEVCMCPAGHSGTSCESCASGWYKDRFNYCRQCNCNGHDCQLNAYNEVVCNCRPPYGGPDCSSLGLVMELLPTFIDAPELSPLLRKVSLVCKYRAAEPLTVRFYHEGQEVPPREYRNESEYYKDGWHGEHVWEIIWDTTRPEEIYECHAINRRGFTLGVLSTGLRVPEGDSRTNGTNRPPLSEPTVIVRISSPTIKIEDVGGTVNFTCQAQSRMTQGRLPVTWIKDDGYLPQGRSQVDPRSGVLRITNLQPSDSGRYICQTSDGISTAQAVATLKVPGNSMSLPSVNIRPAVNEYYEGDRVQLECIASGNPAPRITWQRASNRPLPIGVESFDELLIIESAREEDSGEYRCTASNAAGSSERTALVTVRPRPSFPSRDILTISPTASTVSEGQSTRIVCTGSANVPAGSLDWIRQDGTDFLSNVRSDNGVLYIDVARPENQGVYICQATNSEVAPVPVLVTITPLVPPYTDQPSNITVSVDHVKIPQGGSGSVDCNPTGYPLPLVKWKKYQSEFGPGTSQREHTLIITNAQEDDQGYYLCEGTVNGSPISNIYVYVEIEKREPPRVEIWPAGEQATALSGPFELHCRVLGGVPEPDVTWDRAGGRSLSQYAQLLPQNVLKFDKVEVNDEGEYTCSATNLAGTASASAVLKVRSPPEITLTPGGYVQAVIGDPVTVECRATGYPEPYVSIRKVIVANPDLREVVSQSLGMAVLHIGAASDRDEGDYVCTAESPAGIFEEQFVIRVDRGDGGYVDGGGSGDGEIPYNNNPDNNEPPANIIAFEGSDRRIECNADDGIDVVWRRDGRPLQNNAAQSGGSLIIYNASKSDSGRYECTVLDRYTNEAKQAAYISLLVVAAPRITLRPKTQTVHPGQSPTVECLVDGDDIIDINWRPVNKQPSSRVEIRRSTLIFHQIEVEDAGKYECFARNRHANASAVAEVIVSEEMDRETLESHANEQFAHVGATVHLSCNLSAPGLRIRWTKDGQPVPRSIKQKADGSLFLRHAHVSDSGRYLCIIRDQHGRQTSNYINLHVQGLECLESQFRCYDDTGCVDEDLLCDGYNDCQDNSDEENCLLRGKRLLDSPKDYYEPYYYGPPEETPALVSIDQPGRAFRVGDNVQVLCRASGRGTRVTWERFSDQQQQYVESRTYGDGSMLYIPEVQESDAGVYRCTGRSPYGRTSYDDFNLEVSPVFVNPSRPINNQEVYTARLGASVDMPCNHNLQPPVSIEWRREYSSLPQEVRANEPILRLDRVTEADAGTYVCRVSNANAAVEARAILKVEGVVPRFDGDGWLSLPTLKDAYRQFDIEISFKPQDNNGLILYNSQNEGPNGDYIALHLVDGIPQFVLEPGTGPVIVSGDRPLALNQWHTIRLSRTNSKVTMDVDNSGPFIAESSDQWDILDLSRPLYVGGVPDYDRLPTQLAGTSGFIGCVSMLILGREEKNIRVDRLEEYNVRECDSCTPNLCLNGGICQEGRNERGYMCLCAGGFAGLNCDRTGDACRPGLCGPGKCSDTPDGYKCACPVSYTGRNCDVKQSIEYPAFTGGAFLAIKAPKASRFFKMSLKMKATPPVSDGIVMYCAESARGYGGFTSLAVHDGRLEYRYDLGDGSAPVVLVTNRSLPANEWTDVHIARYGPVVSLKVNLINSYEQKLQSPKRDLYLETPMFVGGVDDSIVLNNNTGVTGGFNGCIKDVYVYDEKLDIVNSSVLIDSANVQECSSDRGDIPEMDSPCLMCRNGGSCASADATSCTCPPGYSGLYCEQRAPRRGEPCAARPCRNGGICRVDVNARNYTCDCPHGFAGVNCQMPLELLQSVGFNGNGYLELPSELVRYEQLSREPAVLALAFHTAADGVLLYQREALAAPNYGDYILLRVDRGRLVLEWDFGSGPNSVTIDEIYVNDGERHEVIVKLNSDNSVSLTVDRDYSKLGYPIGISNLMNADSNIYLGGMPERFNVQGLPGLVGCIEQVELMDSGRGLNLGEVAIAGRNEQRCRESRH